MVNLEDLKDEIKKVYLITDDGIIDILLAAVISNRLTISDKPIWLLIVGPSSGGKTALIQLLDDIGPWIIPVDTLTTNTFASGIKSVEETSLLNKANGGVIIFKDFTALTSMNEDAFKEIMGQLRSIYDGSFNKKTGAGKNIDWRGKVGIIAGGTIAVQRKLRHYSEQGERFINYVLRQPDREEMTRRAILNQRNGKAKEAYLREITANFVNNCLERAFDLDIKVPKDVEDKMIQVANFCTLARSPVILNRKSGKVEWVPEPEMPARMATMLTNLVVTLGIMNIDAKISENNKRTVYRSAFDSIPGDRRLILNILTKFSEATTRTIAIKINYPTETVLNWCNQLNALGIIDRKPGSGGNRGDTWVMKQNYREIVAEFEGLLIGNDELGLSPEEERAYNDENMAINDEVDTNLLEQIQDFGDF
jgi:hypothetical protein